MRQPIIQTPSQEFVLGLGANRVESETSLLDMPYPLSQGADEQGRTRISALRFFQEWIGRDARQVIAAQSQFNLGVGAIDATINEEQPDSRFFFLAGTSLMGTRDRARNLTFITWQCPTINYLACPSRTI